MLSALHCRQTSGTCWQRSWGRRWPSHQFWVTQTSWIQVPLHHLPLGLCKTSQHHSAPSWLNLGWTDVQRNHPLLSCLWTEQGSPPFDRPTFAGLSSQLGPDPWGQPQLLHWCSQRELWVAHRPVWITTSQHLHHSHSAKWPLSPWVVHATATVASCPVHVAFVLALLVSLKMLPPSKSKEWALRLSHAQITL